MTDKLKKHFNNKRGFNPVSKGVYNNKISRKKPWRNRKHDQSEYSAGNAFRGSNFFDKGVEHYENTSDRFNKNPPKFAKKYKSRWFWGGKQRLWPRNINQSGRYPLKRRPKSYKGTAPLYRNSRIGRRYHARFSRSHFYYTSSEAVFADDVYRNSVRQRVGKFVIYYYGVRDFFKSALKLKKIVNFLTLKKTANNFFVTVFKRSGKMLFYKSAGMLKLTGPRRSTVEAAEQVMAKVVKTLKKRRIKKVAIVTRTSSNKFVRSALQKLEDLYDNSLSTLVISLRQKSHNGIRSKKKKRG